MMKRKILKAARGEKKYVNIHQDAYDRRLTRNTRKKAVSRIFKEQRKKINFKQSKNIF
jgi:hypothetical protein